MKKGKIAKTLISLLLCLNMAQGFESFFKKKNIDIRSALLSSGIHCEYSDEIDDLYTEFINQNINTKQLVSSVNDILSNTESVDVNGYEADCNDLELFENLKQIEINYFSCLTDEDKKNLSSKHYDKVIINTDFPFIEDDEGNIKAIDISFINADNVIIKASNNFNSSELIDLIYYINYNKLSDEEKNIIDINSYIKDYNAVEDCYEKLVKIVDSFNFDPDDDEFYKLIAIVNWVTDKLTYDPVVLNAIEKYGKTYRNYDKVAANASASHNENLVNNYVYSDKDEEYGVCANYAALTTILSILSDLDVDYVRNGGHAWCGFNYNGENYYIDPTNFDEDTVYNIQKDNFNKFKEEPNGKKEYLTSSYYNHMKNSIIADKNNENYELPDILTRNYEYHEKTPVDKSENFPNNYVLDFYGYELNETLYKAIINTVVSMILVVMTHTISKERLNKVAKKLKKKK